MAANLTAISSRALPMELPRIERPAVNETGGTSFGERLREVAQSADDHSRSAEALANEYAAGQQNDLHGTMIAGAQADISFRLLASVRNRCVEAYREVMRMGA
jgi:flagellar hook-basal body complex protein FliE